MDKTGSTVDGDVEKTTDSSKVAKDTTSNMSR